jgi:hypothetical protein
MGKLKKKKHFKYPRTYYAEFAFYGWGIIGMGIWFFFHIMPMTDGELYDEVINQDLIGDAKQNFAILLQIIIAKKFGKTGLLILVGILTILLTHLLIKGIKEFRRYKYKCKLYHEGIIKDIFDIYDDYEPKGLIKSIKNLFSKTKKKRYKYPTKKELKNIEKKINDMSK